MTVAKLIKELQKLPPDLEVARSDDEWYNYDFYKITNISLLQVVEWKWWYYNIKRDDKKVKQIVVMD